MAAGIYNFTIEQGTTRRDIFTWRTSGNSSTPINISNYTAKMQVRGADKTLYQELSTANGNITINGVAGEIVLNLTATETSAILWRTGTYQLELTSPGGIVIRLLEGTITIDPEVTL